MCIFHGAWKAQFYRTKYMFYKFRDYFYLLYNMINLKGTYNFHLRILTFFGYSSKKVDLFSSNGLGCLWTISKLNSNIIILYNFHCMHLCHYDHNQIFYLPWYCWHWLEDFLQFLACLCPCSYELFCNEPTTTIEQ